VRVAAATTCCGHPLSCRTGAIACFHPAVCARQGAVQLTQSVVVVGDDIVASHVPPAMVSPMTQSFTTVPRTTFTLLNEKVATPDEFEVMVRVLYTLLPKNHRPVTDAPDTNTPDASRMVAVPVALVREFDGLRIPERVIDETSIRRTGLLTVITTEAVSESPWPSVTVSVAVNVPAEL
jgi:hypothetical protein